MTRNEQADRFVELACLQYAGGDDHRDHREAAELLEREPGIPRATFAAALAAADVDAVREWLAARPELAQQPQGPRGWAPLLYLTYSRVPDAPPPRDALAVARLLLDAGADPNARFVLGGRLESRPTRSDATRGEASRERSEVHQIADRYRFTALTGAIGEGEAGPREQPPHPRARALVELLLDAGADPNDGQALYNTMFTPGDAWLELLLARGLSAEAPVNWKTRTQTSILDYLLGQAVQMGREARVRLLLEHGADPGGRDYYQHRTHRENAQLGGRLAIDAELASHGAKPPDLRPKDRFRAACMAGDREAARRCLATHPDAIEQPALWTDCALHGARLGIDLFLEHGVDVNQRDEHGRTALHQAGWAGDCELIGRLLSAGADPDLRDHDYDATPASFAHQSGALEARDRLLDHTRNVFDLATWGRLQALEVRLAADPGLAAARRARGMTPLHRLEVSGATAARVIDALIARGADVNARTEEGRTPLDSARAMRAEELCELLRARGGVAGA